MNGFLSILFFLLSFISIAQNGYVIQTIQNGDTTNQFIDQQIQWKLIQGIGDKILESKLHNYGNKSDSKFHISSRIHEGSIKEYTVIGIDRIVFRIRFNKIKNTVTYIYPNETIIFKGENIKFDF